MAIVVTAVVAALGAVPGGTAAADDAPGPELRVGYSEALEPDSGTRGVFVPVSLSEAVSTPTTIWFHTEAVPTGDGAVPGLDYLTWGTPSRPRSLTIPAGARQSTINVPVRADDDVDAATVEFFHIVVTQISPGVTLVDGLGLGAIIDSDQANGDVALAVLGGAVHEGDDGPRRAQFSMHLSRPLAVPLTVAYSTSESPDPSATSPGDFVAKSGTVTFAPGQISRTVDVVIPADHDAEGLQDFWLTHSLVGGAAVDDISGFPFMYVLDDDGGPDVTPPFISSIGTGVEVDSAPVAVDFFVLAEDDRDGPTTVVCTPPSGSLFPAGVTIVDCTSTDSAGNSSTDQSVVAVNLV